MFSKKLSVALLGFGMMAVIGNSAFAQMEPGADAAPEAAVAEGLAIDEERTVLTLINKELETKGWSEGENVKKSGKFFIAFGTGVIQAPRSHRNYAGSRVMAFNKAMLQAKRNMAEFLEISIKTETEQAYQEGGFATAGNAKKESVEEESSIRNKVKKLICAKLDKYLRDEGIDPQKVEKEVLAQAAKKQLNSEKFSKLISASAKAYVCGLQVYKSFEFSPKNGKGEIGVIAIWSPTLQQMAEVLLRGGNVPAGMPKKQIIMQIPKSSKDLLLTFGVQQKLDENGNLVLVSFGQEGAISNSRMSANAAYRKAQLNAMAAIREFAGENVAVASDMVQAESTAEFENAAEEYSNESAMREKITATAARMKISGISPLKRWKAKHPTSGKNIYGVICTWSPSAANRAQSMRKQMNVAGESVNAPKAYNQANESQLQGTQFEGGGAAADEDAF